MKTPKNCNCGDHVIPAPQPLDKSCAMKPPRVTFRTKLIPANLGDDTGAYKPEPGSAYDTLVIYQANGAIYFYDSNGVFSCVRPGYADADHELLHTYADLLAELYDPVVPFTEVDTLEELAEVNPSEIPSDAVVSVRHDADHDMREALYFYDVATKEWTFYAYAAPYWTKDTVDTLLELLEERLQNEIKEKVAEEAEERKAADQELHDRIDDVINSPDVRYIVDSHADLEAIDKATVGDQDYARVLKDETRDEASTFYQFSKADQEWNYVGETGPYYTKAEIDARDAELTAIVDAANDRLEKLISGEGAE